MICGIAVDGGVAAGGVVAGGVAAGGVAPDGGGAGGGVVCGGAADGGVSGAGCWASATALIAIMAIAELLNSRLNRAEMSIVPPNGCRAQ